MEDQELVALAQNGNLDAFETLVTRYQKRLYHSLTLVTRHAQDAEDAAQDALVMAYRKLSTFRGNSQFYSWLYRIALNLWISRQRTKARRGPVQPLSAVPPPATDHGSAPDAAMRQAELRCQVHDALNQLTDEYRTVLVLREIDGCDYAQIAEILNLPVGTVRSRLHRARLELKDSLLRHALP